MRLYNLLARTCIDSTSNKEQPATTTTTSCLHGDVTNINNNALSLKHHLSNMAMPVVDRVVRNCPSNIALVQHRVSMMIEQAHAENG